MPLLTRRAARLRVEFGVPSISPWGIALMVLGAAVFYVALTAWLDGRDQLQALRDDLRNGDARLARLRGQVAQQGSSVPPGQLQAVNDAVRRLNVPWNRLFLTVESLRGPDTALLAIEPNAKSGRLNLLAEAKHADAMFAFYERGVLHPQLRAATLKKLEPNDKEAIPVLRFSLEAGWVLGAAATP